MLIGEQQSRAELKTGSSQSFTEEELEILLKRQQEKRLKTC